MNPLVTMSKLVRVRDAAVQRAVLLVRHAARGSDSALERLEEAKAGDEACRRAQADARSALLSPQHGRLDGPGLLGGLARLGVLADRSASAAAAVDLAVKAHAAARAELALESARLARGRGDLRKVQVMRDRLQRSALVEAEILGEQADAESIEMRASAMPSAGDRA